MTPTDGFDKTLAHREFSTDCFNRAWDLIEKPDRTMEDDATLLHLVHASVWHWRQRADCKPRNLSIGYWQISRAYAVVGDAANAKRFGEICLLHSSNEPPFFSGYAHEALARAAMVAHDHGAMARHLVEAGKLATQVTEADDSAMLQKDLDALAG
jgi:hypothetical protein